MNEIMDNRLEKIRKNKNPNKLPSDDIEEYTGLILRQGSRKMTHDQVISHSNKRTFIPIEDLDSPESSFSITKGFFTIGIVVDKSGVKTSKKGSDFCIFKLSDLQKYDMNKVKSQKD
jgi:hypothetical protein